MHECVFSVVNSIFYVSDLMYILLYILVLYHEINLWDINIFEYFPNKYFCSLSFVHKIHDVEEAYWVYPTKPRMAFKNFARLLYSISHIYIVQYKKVFDGFKTCYPLLTAELTIHLHWESCWFVFDQLTRTIAINYNNSSRVTTISAITYWSVTLTGLRLQK
jgi:hypothetical protein